MEILKLEISRKKIWWKKFSVPTSVSALLFILLTSTQGAFAALAPSCDDRELLHLKITASSLNLANPNTNQKKIAVRLRNGRCEIRSLDVSKLDPNEEMKNLDQAREKLKKIKASSSSNEKSTKLEIDVD